MLYIIKNEGDLHKYIENEGDLDSEAAYIAMNRETEECFAITGCTYASEAFRCVNDNFCLVISDDADGYYQDKIIAQLESDNPDLNPFFLRSSQTKEKIL